jgi:hypothetical protein
MFRVSESPYIGGWFETLLLIYDVTPILLTL